MLELLRLTTRLIRRNWRPLDTVSTAALGCGAFLVLASFGPHITVAGQQLPGPYMLLHATFLQFTGFFRAPARLAFIIQWLFALSVGIGLVSLLAERFVARTVACLSLIAGTLFEHMPVELLSRYHYSAPFPVVEELDRHDPTGDQALVVVPDPGSLGPLVFSTMSNWRPVGNAWPDNALLTDYIWFFSVLNDLESSRTGAVLAQRNLKWVLTTTDTARARGQRSPFLHEFFHGNGHTLFRLDGAEKLIADRQAQIEDRLRQIAALRAQSQMPASLSVTATAQGPGATPVPTTEQDSDPLGVVLKFIPEIRTAAVSISYPGPGFPLYDVIELEYSLSRPSPHDVSIYWSSRDIPMSERTRLFATPEVDGRHYKAAFDLSSHPDWLWQDRLSRLRFDVSSILVTGAETVRLYRVTYRRGELPASLSF